MATTSFQHSSYFVSARTGDLINACFLKVTADLLGIRLSGAELDKTTVSFTPLHPVIGGRERSWGRGGRRKNSDLFPAEKQVLDAQMMRALGTITRYLRKVFALAFPKGVVKADISQHKGTSSDPKPPSPRKKRVASSICVVQ